MKVEFTNAFDKQLDDILDKKLLEDVSASVKQVIESANQLDIQNIKKLKGFKNAYRIKTGNYRIGIFITGDSVTFASILHRKEIYRKFP